MDSSNDGRQQVKRSKGIHRFERDTQAHSVFEPFMLNEDSFGRFPISKKKEILDIRTFYYYFLLHMFEYW